MTFYQIFLTYIDTCTSTHADILDKLKYFITSDIISSIFVLIDYLKNVTKVKTAATQQSSLEKM